MCHIISFHKIEMKQIFSTFQVNADGKTLLAYHLALKMLPATHQDSGELMFQQYCHSSQNITIVL